MKKIKTLGAILAIGSLALGESDESLIKSVEFVDYNKQGVIIPSVKVTADLSALSVSTNQYVFEYSTNLVDWVSDSQTITTSSLSRTFQNRPSVGYYKLKRVNY